VYKDTIEAYLKRIVALYQKFKNFLRLEKKRRILFKKFLKRFSKSLAKGLRKRKLRRKFRFKR